MLPNSMRLVSVDQVVDLRGSLRFLSVPIDVNGYMLGDK